MQPRDYSYFLSLQIKISPINGHVYFLSIDVKFQFKDFDLVCILKEKNIRHPKKMSDSTTNNNQSTANRVLCAFRDVLYSARVQGEKPDGKFIKRYRKYVADIDSARSKNGKARAIAKHFVPNEDEYNRKVASYPNWYEGELLASLLKLLELFREIALAPPPPPEEKSIPSREELDSFMAEIFGHMKLNS